MIVINSGEKFLIQDNNRVCEAMLLGSGILTGEWKYGDEAEKILQQNEECEATTDLVNEVADRIIGAVPKRPRPRYRRR